MAKPGGSNTNNPVSSMLNDMPRTSTGGMVVPPGRSLADMPKGEPKPVPSGAAKPRNTRLTLRQLVTEDETKNYLVELLVSMGTTKKKGPWREYLEFYRANLSGDIDSMNEANKAKCEKMVKELNDAYFDAQEL